MAQQIINYLRGKLGEDGSSVYEEFIQNLQANNTPLWNQLNQVYVADRESFFNRLQDVMIAQDMTGPEAAEDENDIITASIEAVTAHLNQPEFAAEFEVQMARLQEAQEFDEGIGGEAPLAEPEEEE